MLPGRCPVLGFLPPAQQCVHLAKLQRPSAAISVCREYLPGTVPCLMSWKVARACASDSPLLPHHAQGWHLLEGIVTKGGLKPWL
jgi:hypothetical protein